MEFDLTEVRIPFTQSTSPPIINLLSPNFVLTTLHHWTLVLIFPLQPFGIFSGSFRGSGEADVQ